MLEVEVGEISYVRQEIQIRDSGLGAELRRVEDRRGRREVMECSLIAARV